MAPSRRGLCVRPAAKDRQTAAQKMGGAGSGTNCLLSFVLGHVKPFPMKRVFSVVLILAGLAAMGWGVKPLLLLAVGERIQATVTAADTGQAETEMQRRRRSQSKATGYFRVDVRVEYRFDVLPTATEALQRLSTEPLHRGVTGVEVIDYRVREVDAVPVKAGDSVRVRYLRAYPALNMADLPRSAGANGATAVLGGLAAVALGWWLRRRPRKNRATST